MLSQLENQKIYVIIKIYWLLTAHLSAFAIREATKQRTDGGIIMAIMDVVRFDGLKSRDWVIYKFPSESITYGSQLVVQEGQSAFFVKGGVVADEFRPGTYTLRSDNLPILHKIMALPFGGNTPFSAEIYFINTTIKLDSYWGTVDPIQIVDPKYYVRLHIRAFGQMGLRIADSRQVFTKLVGSMQKSELVRFERVAGYFKGLIVSKVKSAIADVIITKRISALEIAVKQEAISVSVLEAIKPSIEHFGLELVNFYIQSINFPDDDFANINKILEDKAAFEIMGDSRYAVKRSFDVYEGAANNTGTAGSVVAGGVGLGAALQMGSSLVDRTATAVESSSAAGGGASSNQNPPMNSQYMKQCVRCKRLIRTDANFCPECGADNQSRICTCGYEIKEGMRFCPQCGKEVTTQ